MCRLRSGKSNDGFRTSDGFPQSWLGTIAAWASEDLGRAEILGEPRWWRGRPPRGAQLMSEPSGTQRPAAVCGLRSLDIGVVDFERALGFFTRGWGLANLAPPNGL